ncbi:MAG TPA: succinate--CoA ligase subunit alpha [Anaerolineaceae bacterium]|nr:succinate--CoA ligase subunit alpha [Anaerolineaceae bacterium]HPN53091.1 succinate--CoA ligase subunit alpha [Anaerolineaceae bacterium]
MSILVNKSTRLLIQGITGREGLYHAQKMLLSGTSIVAGVTPGKGGEWMIGGKIPVFDSVHLAYEISGANAALVFVPAHTAPDAIFEAADAGVPLIICITEGIPIYQMLRINAYLKQKGIRLIGPKSPGIISPGECCAGIIPPEVSSPGNIGVVSRAGTLTFTILENLKQAGLGVSTCVGIGSDPIIGTSFKDILEMFEADPHTEKVVLVGEIGGKDEEEAASYIPQMTKPVCAYIAGLTAQANKRYGHAGAIIERGAGLAVDKNLSLVAAGVRMARHPEELPELLS